MNIRILKPVAVASIALSALGAQAADQVLNFDDINFLADGATHSVFGTAPGSRIAVFNNPTSYHGFNFGTAGSATNPWYAAENICAVGCILTSAEYAASSGDTVVALDDKFGPVDGIGNPVRTTFDQSPTITSATPFRFIGASFTGGVAAGNSGNQVKYELLDNLGNTVYTSPDLTSTAPSLPLGQLTNVPVFLSNPGSNLLIYGVKIQSQWALYAMDDFTYNTSPVPELGSYAMFLVGLGIVGAVARKRCA